MKECRKVLTTSINDTNPKGENVKRIIIDRDINGAKKYIKNSKKLAQKQNTPKSVL